MQGTHAAIEAVRHGLISSYAPHPHLVFCGAKNLQKEADRLDLLGISYRLFFEPDLNNQLTAIATEPVSCDRKALSHLSLIK